MPITGGGGGVTDHGLLTGLTNDDHPQYLLLAGRTGGQTIGSNSHASGNSTDLAIEGRILIGNNLSSLGYTAGRVLDSRPVATNGTILHNFQVDLAGLTGTISGTLIGTQVLISGTSPATAGSSIIRGLAFISSGSIGTGATLTESTGGRFQSAMQEGASALTTGINNHYGLYCIALGPTLAASGHTATQIIGCRSDVLSRSKKVDTIANFYCGRFSGTISAQVTRWGAFISELTTVNSTTPGLITTYYGILLNDTGAGNVPVNIYGIYVNSGFYTKNVLGVSTTIGAASDPLHSLDVQGNLGVTISGVKVGAYAPALETVIPCNAAAGAFAINLPTAVGIKGRVYIIKKTDATANAVNVTPNGAETIDGAAPYVLNVQWQVVRIISDGANWLVI